MDIQDFLKGEAEAGEILEKASTKTKECPECGTPVPIESGYCVDCDKQVGLDGEE